MLGKEDRLDKDLNNHIRFRPDRGIAAFYQQEETSGAALGQSANPEKGVILMDSKPFTPLRFMAMELSQWSQAKSRISKLRRQEHPFFKSLRIACYSLLVLVISYAAPARADQSDTHYFEIRQLNGTIVSIELIRSADGRKIGIAYLYPSLTRNLNSLPVQRMSVPEFQRLVREGSPPPAPLSTGYATGMAIGYNDSIGAAPGLCYNFTSQKNATSTNANFSVTNSISSIAQSINVSSSVQGSYDAFSASDDFTYSDSYNATSNSGSAYLTALSTFTITNAPDPGNLLNQAGLDALNGGTFGAVCGAAYMNTVLGGMSVVGRINWASSSSTQAQKFQEAFQTGAGLDNLSTAVSEAQTVSHQSFSCGFSLTILGGGKYGTDIMTDLGSNTSNLTSCCQGTTSACTAFSTNMDKSITTNVGDFAGNVSANWPANNAPDFDSLGVAAFPEGLAGVANPRITTAVSTLGIPGITDPWDSVSQALQNYVTVLNQVRTLENRAKSLSAAVDTTFNPTQLMNLQQYLNTLSTGYGNTVGSGTNAVAKTMLANLKTCLEEQTNNDVDTNCASIVQSGAITNAYDMFSKANFTGSNQWLLQQNSVALQYNGIFTNDNSYTWPMDVLYIDHLPPFTGQSALMPIGNQAALTGFTDASFYDNGETKSIPALGFLPLWPNSDLQDTYSTDSQDQKGVFLTPNAFKATRSFLPANIPQPGLWYGIWGQSVYPSYSNDDMISWTSPNCSPTFDNPCGIGYGIPKSWNGVTWGGYPLSLSMTQIPDLFDASLGSSEGPRLSSGTVKGLNTVGKGKIHLAGTYRRPDSLDLSNTQLSVDLLLYERGAGGAGGLGELVMAVCCGHRREIVPPPMPKGKPITPITLIRRGKSPWHAVYETRRGAEPRIEIHLISHPESPLLHVRVNIDKASIAVPAACQNGKERVDLGHRITLQNKISHVSRSLISRQGWDCVSKDDGVNELRLLEVP